MGLRMSVAWGCAGAQHGGCARAQHGAVHGRAMVLRTGAQWCCAGALRGAAHGVCEGACMGGGGRLTTGFWRLPRRGPHQEDIGAWAASAMRGLTTGCWPRAVGWEGGGWHGAAQGRSMGLRMSAAWGCA